MSALITTTSQAVELVLKDNGNIVSTSYPETLEQAVNQAESLGITSIEFEELNF